MENLKAAFTRGSRFFTVLFSMLMLASCATPTATKTVRTLNINGEISPDVLKEVRAAVLEVEENPNITMLRVNITSPGGEAFSGFEIAQTFRRLSDKKHIAVEIHASSLCASACSWILASGTPGHRIIHQHTLVLIHPLQRGGGFGPATCTDHRPVAKDLDDQTVNVIMDIARDLYVQFTGRPVEDVEVWLTCGKEQVNNGKLAIKLGMADILEKD